MCSHLAHHSWYRVHTATTALLVFLVFHVLYHIACWCQGNLFFFIIYSCHTYIMLNFCEWHKMPSWHSRFLNIQCSVNIFWFRHQHVCSYIEFHWVHTLIYTNLPMGCVFNSKEIPRNRKSFALLDSVHLLPETRNEWLQDILLHLSDHFKQIFLFQVKMFYNSWSVEKKFCTYNWQEWFYR